MLTILICFVLLWLSESIPDNLLSLNSHSFKAEHEFISELNKVMYSYKLLSYPPPWDILVTGP